MATLPQHGPHIHRSPLAEMTLLPSNTLTPAKRAIEQNLTPTKRIKLTVSSGQRVHSAESPRVLKSVKPVAVEIIDVDVEEDLGVVLATRKETNDASTRFTITLPPPTAQVNAEIDAAGQRWFFKHRTLVAPLLQQDSAFLRKLKTEQLAGYVPREQVDVKQPWMVEGKMTDYQLDGLSFMVWMYKNGMNCLLGDEMGLGKTLQTLSLFAWIQENATSSVDPHLVLCPLSVLSSWMSEAHRWTPKFKVLRIHGAVSERIHAKDAFSSAKYNIVVTTYETYVAEHKWFKQKRWTYCVLDEGHRIKNRETLISKSLAFLGAKYRLILSGTPVQNNLVELFSLFRWLYPSAFTGPAERLFRAAFDLTSGTYDTEFMDHAKKFLGTIMLRRTKAEVETTVLPREEITLFIPMSECQRFWTYSLLTRMNTVDLQDIFNSPNDEDELDVGRAEIRQQVHNHVKRASTGKNNQYQKLANLLLQLRRICDHPYLLKGAEPEDLEPGEHLVAASTKLSTIEKLLQSILPTGERVLIFSQWTGMLDVVEDFLGLRGISYARLDGGQSRARRALDIRLFQQETSPYQVFLLSTSAGGLGINLTRANHVIMCDASWNPQVDLQAIARAHRIGQTKTVKVYWLVCKGSVEDQMLDRIRRKLFLSVKVMNDGGSANDDDLQLNRNALLSILRKGSSILDENVTKDDRMDLRTFLTTPIETLVQRSRQREKDRKHRMNDVRSISSDEEKRLLAGVVAVQSRVFEGRHHHRVEDKPNHQQIGAEWTEIQKRACVNRIVMVNGIETIADNIFAGASASVTLQTTAVKKEKKPKFETEDWCIFCRDGGDLFECALCPRVFHASCRGYSKTVAKKMYQNQIKCPQHLCALCDRNSHDVGGLLYRCRTCPQAFCEECLPEGNLDVVGDTLPEFELLGFGAMSQAYYINCIDCIESFQEDPRRHQSWLKEKAEIEACHAEKFQMIR